MILNKHNKNVNFVSKFLEPAQHFHIYDTFHKKHPLFSTARCLSTTNLII